MAFTYDIESHNLGGGQGAPAKRWIRGSCDLGTYAADGVLPTAAGLLAAAKTELGRTDISFDTLEHFMVGQSLDPDYRFAQDPTSLKVKAFVQPAASLNAGALPAVTVTTTASLTLDAGKLSEALPAGAAFVLGGRSSGGTAGVIKLVPDAPANTLEAQYIPASRKIQLLAADANTGLVVQYASFSQGTLPTINSDGTPAEAGNGADLSSKKFQFVAFVS